MLCFRTTVVLYGALLSACARTEHVTDSDAGREVGLATTTFLSAAARGDTTVMRTVAVDSVVGMYVSDSVVSLGMLQAAAATVQIDSVEARDNRANAAFSYVFDGKSMHGTVVAARNSKTWKLVRVSILVEY